MPKAPTKTLTEAQITQLFNFVRNHYVDYFDVQVELIDHLANDIEQQWGMEPTLSFDDALHIAFKRFGVFGFSDLVATKKDKLSNSYLKKMFTVFTQYFSLPQVVFTLALFFSLFYSLLYFINYLELAFFGFVLILLTVYLTYGLAWQREIKEYERNTGKKWLITSVALRTFAGYASLFMFQIGLFITQIDTHYLSTNTSSTITYLRVAIYVTFIVSYSLWTYITLFVYRPYMREEIAYNTAQYKLN